MPGRAGSVQRALLSLLGGLAVCGPHSCGSCPALFVQTTPLVAGLAVGVAAYAGRAAIQAVQSFRASGPRMRAFYKGGFLPEMTRREAALILGVRESAPEEKVKEAHRRIMIANHPDAGGSSFIATKVNEAKDMLAGKRNRGGSVF